MIKITNELLDKVVDKSKKSPRKRCNYNFHKDKNEPVQRFLNALQPDTYLRPHKHLGGIEIFLILRGRVLILVFDNNGEIKEYLILDYEKGDVGVEILPHNWHSFIALQENSILYEIKEGPFIEGQDKIFANWAPEEGSRETIEFNKKILKKLKID